MLGEHHAAPSSTSFVALVAWAFGPGAFAQPVAAPTGTGQPNIVFVLTDNLGYGEVGAYEGGATRGAPTPRIDSLAREGMRFLNCNMETQCMPSRSRLMTGRWAVRSGTHSVPFGGVADGLTR